ncbi:MAG: sigma-54-dependent Fis family transcriptional regulator [Planctomycetes bacterium RBG_16_64_12]|nr:MAG: sigma-54-dependent Fis family transcriptional regulator [Planctomycetes bacterium RBG_16_64_12]
MNKGSLLLVDDDRQVLASMADWLREQGYQVDTAASCATATEAIKRKRYEVVLVDIRLGDGDGFDILAHCRRDHPQTSVIMITGYGTVESAVEAIRAGAFDFLTKPLIDQELEMAIERALSQRKVIEENENLKAQLDMRFGMENIIGHDRRMLRIYDMIDSVADTKATVLITGESGTGKSLIARAIHRRSSRRDKPFVEVACGALPETLLESELFGHAAGAFTGATGEKMGKFMQANEGTIFLDEVATASPGMQVKLLRILQDFEFEQVGGTRTFTVNIRAILATNEDLATAVAEGRFRQDLYYRVNVINIELPNLRERISDIPLLARHFLEQVCEDSGKSVRGITDEAMAALQGYRWPGNVRELENVIERAVLLGKSDMIGLADLPPGPAASGPIHVETVGARSLKQALEGPQRQIILEVLEANAWNRQATAEALGINRTTLYKKMRRLGLEEPRHAAVR